MKAGMALKKYFIYVYIIKKEKKAQGRGGGASYRKGNIGRFIRNFLKFFVSSGCNSGLITSNWSKSRLEYCPFRSLISFCRPADDIKVFSNWLYRFRKLKSPKKYIVILQPAAKKISGHLCKKWVYFFFCFFQRHVVN